MVKAPLVSVEVERGAQILGILDAAGLKISAALWVYLAEYEDWRLALASRRLNEAGVRDAFGLVHDALDAAGFRFESTPPLLILLMKDPFIRELRRTFAKDAGVEGIRLGGQRIGDRFVEDAFVYRIS